MSENIVIVKNPIHKIVRSYIKPLTDNIWWFRSNTSEICFSEGFMTKKQAKTRKWECHDLAYIYVDFNTALNIDNYLLIAAAVETASYFKSWFPYYVFDKRYYIDGGIISLCNCYVGETEQFFIEEYKENVK